jgi:hypothetical protein
MADRETKIEISPTFKFLLSIVLGLIVLSWLVATILAVYAKPSVQVNGLIELAKDCIKLSIGGILGLLGGKVS